MIFSCSMSDFFHEAADGWRDEAWDVIRRTPQHTYQILTKRPERIAQCLPTTCFRCGRHASRIENEDRCRCDEPMFWYRATYDEDLKVSKEVWPNVWLGTSVEMQLYLEPRWDELTRVPAAVHFLSCEPLLGPLDFSPDDEFDDFLHHIEWVIAGGESDYAAPRLSPDLLDWFRSIRADCYVSEVPFFLKQIGGTSKCDCHGSWGCRILDGRTHDEMPSIERSA